MLTIELFIWATAGHDQDVEVLMHPDMDANWLISMLSS